MKKILFYLDFLISSQFFGLLWAQEKGYYSKYGLDVDLIEWKEDGKSIIEKVINNVDISLGSSEDNLIISACDEGYKIKALATMLQKSPLVIMTKKNKNINSIKDLIGKKVAMHCDGIKVFEAILDIEKIDRKLIDYKELPCDPDRLLNDEFDGVQGYAMAEPIHLEMAGVKLSLISVTHHNLNPYAQVFFTTDENIISANDEIRAFLTASFMGFKDSLNHREEVAEIVLKKSKYHKDFESTIKVINEMVPYLTDDKNLDKYGALDLNRWKRNLKTYEKIGLIKNKLMVIDTVNNCFIEDIYGLQDI